MKSIYQSPDFKTAAARWHDEERRLRAINAELLAALMKIVYFCDDPCGDESTESLAMGLSRMLPEARAAIAKAEQATP